MIFKCKMCGGTLELQDGATIAECEYCGAKQTVPNVNDERIANLYERANHFRRNSDFDKAAVLFEQILEENKTDAEAYWSLVLCRYGIEYVEDPLSHRRVPTVNRTQFTSIFDDENYKSAIQLCDSYQRILYEEEAKTINEIQKGILAISQQEDPYDVFICYKETDNVGTRTIDSVIANDLYNQLDEAGLKVFFARITLEDKLGEAYEPYIFAALNSAKVMVVVGSKPEYFNAVWVKNEWSRFLSLIRNGEKKTLIPAYKDMDPYDLPIEFSHLQAQDMSKLGFMQDLTRGIKKILGKDKKQNSQQVVETVVINKKEVDEVEVSLKRAFLFIEDGDYTNAETYCEKVLNIDPECSQAYVAKLLIECNLRKLSDLDSYNKPIVGSANYSKALRFADEENKTLLQNYNNSITKRVELQKKEDSYLKAEKLRNNGSYDEAIEEFKKILDYRDSAGKIEKCKLQKEFSRKDAIYKQAIGRVNSTKADDLQLKESIAQLRTIEGHRDANEQAILLERRLDQWYEDKRIAEEQTRIKAEQERIRKQKQKAKIKRTTIIMTPIVTAIVVAIVLIITVVVPTIKFNKANELFIQGKYDEAQKIYSEIGDFKSSEQNATVIQSIKKVEENEYQQAVEDLLDVGVPVRITYKIEDEGIVKVSNNVQEDQSQIVFCSSAVALAPQLQEDTVTTEIEYKDKNNFDSIMTPIKRGYRFLGWKLISCNYDVVAKDAQFEMVLLATWSEKEFVIIYNLDGGEVSGNIKAYSITDDAFTLKNPTRVGYTFLGWTGTGLDTPTLTVTIESGSDGDRSYKANWKPNEYNVYYDANGGTIENTSQVVRFDENYILQVPIRIGYTFAGWYDGTTRISNGKWKIVHDVNLQAKWTINQYIITLDANGGSVETNSIIAKYGEEITLPIPMQIGYTFAGWYDGTTMLTDESSYTFAMPAENKTYTAKWEVNAEMSNFIFASTSTNCKITGVKDNTVTEIVVPQYVTSIGDYAFYDCSSITSIIIPDSVTSIGYGAFSGCSSLAEMTIPFVGPEAGKTSSDTYQYPFGYIFGMSSYTGGTATKQYFYGSSTSSKTYDTYYIPSSLKSVTVTGGKVLYGAFYNCSNLTSITIANSVTSIGYSAFSGCSSLTQMTIPFVGAEAGKTSSDTYQYPFGYIFGTSSYVGGVATEQYYYGSSTSSTTSTKYYIPSSLKSVTVTGDNILYGAFYGCSNLTSITLPTNLTSIGRSAFDNCSSLTKITIPNSVTSIGYGAFYKCSSLTKITIPNSVTSIGSCAFNNCSSLTSINIPDSVTSIGSSTFYNCSSLTRVDITDIAKWCAISFGGVDANPLYNAHNLYLNGELVTNLVISEGVTSIGSSAFYNCSSLTNITIPDSVTSIGEYAFSNCSNLTSVTIEENSKLTSIGSSAFYNCSSLASITIPDSVTSIGEYAFSNCNILTNITIPDSVTSIGDDVFYNCSSLTSINIPNNVTSIGDDVFYNCSSLTSVTIEENSKLTSIGNSAFYNCSSLTNITIPDSVTSIGSSAFYNCSSLTSVNIPDSVTSIGDGAFDYCSSLTSFTIGNGVTSISSGLLFGCGKLESLTIPFVGAEAGKTYRYPLGYIFGTASYTGGVATTQYSSSSTYYKYYIPSSLKSVTVTGGNILYGAFYNCSGITSITIPDSMTSIGEDAFYNCSSLISVNIPDGVTSIGEGAFYNCTSLTRVDITDIAKWCAINFGSNPLNYAHNLYLNGELVTNLAIPEGVTSIGSGAFSGCSSLTNITMPDSVTSIESSAFVGCSSLTSINVPDSVTSIGNSAFYNCSSLTSITIPNSVTTIESRTFYNCSSLTDITIPDSVTSIEEGAFSYCSNIQSMKMPFVGQSRESSGIYAVFGYVFGMTMDSSDWIEQYRIHWENQHGGGSGWNVYRYNIPKTIREVIITDQEKLPKNAFYNCDFIESITFPSNLSVIEESAFSNTALKAINIADLTKWCNLDCKSKVANSDTKMYLKGELIVDLLIPNGITSISNYVFAGCSFETLFIPDSVTSIGNSAFSYNYNLKSVKFGPGSELVNIGKEAFKYCRRLTSITIPKNVEMIGDDAFLDCDKLVEVYNLSPWTIKVGSESEGKVGYYALDVYTNIDEQSKISTTIDGFVVYSDSTSNKYYLLDYVGNQREITLPDNIDGNNYEIYKYAFYNNNYITKVEIPEGVTKIGMRAFSGCSNLLSVTIPSTVTSIGEYAFYGCSKISKMVIPEGVTNIGMWAFGRCRNLLSVTIPSTIISIGDSAFYDCYKLVEVYNLSSKSLSKGSTNYGYLGYYALDIYTSIDTPSKLSKTVDGFITYANDSTNKYYLLSYVGEANDITLPININGNKYDIYKYAFYQNTKIESVKISIGVKEIGSYAFGDCCNLTSVTMPNSVTSIREYAFSNCSSLTSIKFQGTKEQWNAISKSNGWNSNTGAYTIVCTDGTISK